MDIVTEKRKAFTDTQRLNFLEKMQTLNIDRDTNEYYDERDGEDVLVSTPGEFCLFTFDSQWKRSKTLRGVIDIAMGKELDKTNIDTYKHLIGKEIMITARSGMCTGGMETVTGILSRFDKHRGETQILICFGDHWFNSKTGLPFTAPWAYDIDTDDLIEEG